MLAKLCGGVFKCLHTGNTYKCLPDIQVSGCKVPTVTGANVAVASANLTAATAFFAATSASIAVTSANIAAASALFAAMRANITDTSAKFTVASASSAAAKAIKIVASALFEVGTAQTIKKGDLLNHPSFEEEFV